MRILMIAPEQIPVPPVLGGSVEISIWAIARRLSNAHEVTIISRSHKRYPNKERRENVNMIRVRGDRPSAYIHAVLDHVRRAEYDLIQVDNRPRFVPLVKGAFPHTPIVLFLHSLTFVSPARLSRTGAKACLNQADGIIANSRSLLSRLGRRFPEQAAKLSAIPLGVDFVRFRPPTSAERQRLRSRRKLSKRFVVLYAGRIIPRKGVGVLIRAAALAKQTVPDLTLLVAGCGRPGYVSRLRKLARKARVPLQYAGNVPHSRIQRLYQTADCFVCPSQKHEAFGLVNVEAMACGLPVIASRIGGIPEIITSGKNGFLIDSYTSPLAFSRIIDYVRHHRESCGDIAGRGLETARKKFGWDSTAARLAEKYAHLAEKHRRVVRGRLHADGEGGEHGKLYSQQVGEDRGIGSQCPNDAIHPGDAGDEGNDIGRHVG